MTPRITLAHAFPAILRSRHGILVQAMANDEYGGRRRPEISGIRVSPNVFTTPAELDRFARALAVTASAARG